MNKKAIFVRILEVLVRILPPLITLICYGDVIIARADRTISVAAIFVMLIVFLVFRDVRKKIFDTPSAFKIMLFVFIISILGYILGEQMFWISATGLVGSIVAIPLNIWYKKLTRPATKDELIKALEGMSK